jgi:hypothetical protein
MKNSETQLELNQLHSYILLSPINTVAFLYIATLFVDGITLDYETLRNYNIINNY